MEKGNLIVGILNKLFRLILRTCCRQQATFVSNWLLYFFSFFFTQGLQIGLETLIKVSLLI